MAASTKSKVNLFCNVLHDNFEKQVEKILDEESDFEKYDRKLDPLIREYFDRILDIEEYFSGDDDEGEEVEDEEYEEYIKSQKLALTITLCDKRFEDSVASDILSGKSLKS